MNKYLIVIGIAIILIAVGLSGCTDNSNNVTIDDRLIGTWKTYELDLVRTFIFFSDGTCSIPIGLGQISGVFEIKDEKLVVTADEGSGIMTYDYYFTDNDTRLYLTEVGSSFTFPYMKE